MTRREDKTVAVYPFRIRRVDLKVMAEENRTDLGGSEWKPEMTGTACVNGVDSQASGLIGGLLENFLVLHSLRVGEKLIYLLALAGYGENYLYFFRSDAARYQS